MKYQTPKLILVFLALGLIVSFVAPSVLRAQTSSTSQTNNQTGQAANQTSDQSTQGLSISPFLFDERLDKGQTIERTIDLKNDSGQTITIIAAVKDFAPGDRDGQPVFLPEGEQPNPIYSLSKWVSITSQFPIVLQAGQSAKTTFRIAVPQAGEEGSRYGAVLFTYVTEQKNSDDAQIIKKTGALLLVRVGTANEQGKMSQFSTDKSFYTAPPVKFQTTFTDTGNVHLKPKGNISVYNMFGALVVSIPINRDAQIQLPQTARTFAGMWQAGWTLGRYTATAHIYYGDSKLEAVSTISFWMFPFKTIGLSLVIAIVLIILLWYGLKRYNRWIISRYG